MSVSTFFLKFMSFILSIHLLHIFYKNYTANHRSFQLFSMVYVLYIITNVFGKISLKIIPRIIAVSKSFLWNLSFILSMSFFYLFTKKLYRESSQLPTFFCYICPLYYQYIYCTFHTYRIPQFTMSVSPFLPYICPLLTPYICPF